MNRLFCLLLTTAAAAWVAGCRGVAPPNWSHPGTAAYQQSEAERFDPYPENETGPAIVGGRPREFQKPPAEPTRARWLPWSWAQR